MRGFSSDFCCETLTMVLGKVRDGSCCNAEGALTKLMLCSNSFFASLCPFASFSFILLKFLQKCQQQSKRKHLAIAKHSNIYLYNTVRSQEVPILMVSLLPTDSDLINLRNGLEYIISKIPVVSLGPVSFPLKLEG